MHSAGLGEMVRTLSSENMVNLSQVSETEFAKLRPGREEAVFGISLVDGSTWQCSVTHRGVRKLTLAEAWRWESEGPADVELGPEDCWW
jgi:hypothetical protein